MPASLEMPADSRASRIAAASKDASTLPLAPSANCASASDRASRDLGRAPSAACAERRDSSIILAMKMVQVTSEAKARPIMTALTTTSADLNIDHGDNSLQFGGARPSAVCLALGAASAAGVAGAAGGAGSAPGAGCAGRLRRRGACWAATRRRCGRPCRCWADDGAASDSIASAEMHRKCRRARKRHVLHTSAQ